MSVPHAPLLRRLSREARMSTEQPPQESAPASAEEPSSPPSPVASSAQRVWDSADLLGDQPEALINHRGQTYRLRCTKQGKLILYK
jgi:hemin uptake protein HemP